MASSASRPGSGSSPSCASAAWGSVARSRLPLRRTTARVELITGVEGASSRPVRRIVLREG